MQFLLRLSSPPCPVLGSRWSKLIDSHPELDIEQAHLDHAIRRLEETREQAIRLQTMVEVGKGGTNQARYEREIINTNIATRLASLDVGDRSLAFGRIDQTEEAGAGSYVIGRIAISSEDIEPLIVDWRAPIAEAFYRATGADNQGLVRRRHFISRRHELLGLEDEFFGDAATAQSVVVDGRELRGQGALVAALETSRTGRLGDIVGTIQGEQDEIIRAPLDGVMVVQGGPGTGKTVVALHRAAYLLYTHRFPLEGQGVLVVGPNRLFLGYIEQVLPSLGEAGIHMAVLADLVSGVRVQGRDEQMAARVKGDLRMVHVLRRAMRDRQQPLRSELVVGYGTRRLRLSVQKSQKIVDEARRRFRTHNAARNYVMSEVVYALARSHPDKPDPDTIVDGLRHRPEVREALLWMWPTLSPAQFLHDLYGAPGLLASATRRLDPGEGKSLGRPWHETRRGNDVLWTIDDVPVLDEAWEMLGPLPKDRKTIDPEVRTYGHIVVDEAQDLSPMQLRMLTRRSLNGSMTVVGDIAQSTGAWAHADWDEVLEHLPNRKPTSRRYLSVGYRIPGPSMALAAKVLPYAAPDLKPPVSVRDDGQEPTFVHCDATVLFDEVVSSSVSESVAVGAGNVAVVVPDSLAPGIIEAFRGRQVAVGSATKDGLSKPITVVPVGLVKGLEVDVSIVVEPAEIISSMPQGDRSLYVALTRATKHLVIVHSRPLPHYLQ